MNLHERRRALASTPFARQARYLTATRPGRYRVVRVVVQYVALAVALAQAAIWIDGPEDPRQGLWLSTAGIVLFLFALAQVRPPTTIAERVHLPFPAEVRVTVSDLFDYKPGETIVIGVSDLVDNRFPAELDARTLIAQALDRIERFDGPNSKTELHNALWADSSSDVGEPLPLGYITRFQLRTERNALLVLVFGRTTDVVHETTPTEMMDALANLWATARDQRIEHLRLPVLGSGFGGAKLPRPSLIALVLTSYRFALSQGPVCSTLEICIRPEDYDPADIVSAKAAMTSMGFG